MHSVYVSTGFSRALPAHEEAQRLFDSGCPAIELSAGAYVPESQNAIRKLGRAIPIRLHNYIPVPETPFVINLASQDESISTNSMNLVCRALELSADVGAVHYAVHAGFRFDPDPRSLGGALVPTSPMLDEDLAEIIMIDRLMILAQKAQALGVRLLLENHSLTAENLMGASNPLLFAGREQILRVMEQSASNFGFLLDVGHLQVSTMTLGENAEEAMLDLACWVEGYHLSENNGLVDEHQVFDQTAWFFRHINPACDYVTIEVCSSPSELAALVKVVERQLC